MYILRSVPGSLHYRKRCDLYLTRSSIMAVFDREKNIEYQEKELLICENCGAVITTKEHLHFMHRKLGPKAFSSILNLNMLNQKLGLAEGHDLDVEIRDGLKRKDMFNVICPNCLRQVLVKYLFKGA